MLISPGFRRGVRIGCLLVFAVLSIGINFFHTENTLADQANCPACHFLVFSQSVGPVLFFILPLLIVLGSVQFEVTARRREPGFTLHLSRSPPGA